jgi:hypothetical protein
VGVGVGGALLTCCSGGTESPPQRLGATVIRPPKDTVGFALPATAHHCDDGLSLLLEAATPLGNGVLVRLRHGDSLISAAYPVIAPGDYSTRGAQVAVRYMLRDVAHAFAVDSGSVEVQLTRRALDARVRGSGLDGFVRTPVTAEFKGVPLAADTVPCRYQP